MLTSDKIEKMIKDFNNMIDKRIYDISVLLGQESVDYPGDPPFKQELVSDMEKGGGADVSSLSMCAHAGTHIDAPAHFIKDGKRVDEYGVEKFTMPAVVIEVSGSGSVGPDDIAGHEIKEGGAVLFKTENSKSGLSKSGEFCKEYVYIKKETAKILADMKVSLVGIDYLSIDEYDSENHPAHNIFAKADTLILEGIDLSEVPPGNYTLICLPLKIKAEAAPARAILISRFY
jgi:arylformamidase